MASGRLLRVESLESRDLLSFDAAGIEAVGLPPEPPVANPPIDQTGVVAQVASTLPILRGEVKAGTISARGEVDRYTFRGAAGDRVFISLSDIAPGGDFWGRAALFSPAGRKIGMVSDGFSRMFKLPAAGKYSIRVYDWSRQAIGDYALALEGIKPVSLDALTIDRGDVKAGRIDVPGEVDAYRFAGKAGDRVYLSLSDMPGDFWGRATIYSPAGTAVGTVSDGFSGTFTLPVAGTYVILVHDWTFTDAGDYSLALEGINPVSLDAVAANRGDVKAGRIDVPGEVDAYTFTGAANDAVFLSLSDLPGDFWGRATLYSPAGTEVGEVSDGFSESFRLPAAGTYVILVHDWRFTDVGDYGLTLNAGASVFDLPAATSLTALTSYRRPHMGQVIVV